MRISELSQVMPGTSKAEVNPREPLLRLFDGDVTEGRTSYVGRLSDGRTLGFWLLVLGQPYAGRAIPSEKTLNRDLTSRN